MNIKSILTEIKNGTVDIEKAEEILKNLPYEDLGFAKLDFHRSLRRGVAEVVFCQGKTDGQLIQIFQKLSAYKLGDEKHKAFNNVLGTRATYAQYEAIKAILPEVTYDKVSGILKLEVMPKEKKGLIAICTGGTSDLFVAEEAAQVVEFLGVNAFRLYDVGVAGIHRILSKLEDLRKAQCIIAVAGMEGALPGIVAGLVDKPVIAVPTSIGYGASFGGLSALLTMLNSCAEGVTVVNIDNGFGAAYSAVQIVRLIQEGKAL